MKAIERKSQAERLSIILTILEKDKRVSVEELCALFGISGVTVRNDLRLLSSEGKLIKTYGGALFKEKKTAIGLFDSRNIAMHEEKMRIGEKAASLVHDKDVIYLDASVTVMEMIPFILDRINLTVVTNSLEIASNLSILSNHTVAMLGGTIFRETFATIWSSPEIITPEVNINTAFIGALGLSTKIGLTDRNINVIQQKRYVISKSHRVIALVDSSKWGQVSFGTFAKLDQINTVITDAGAPQKDIDDLRQRDIEVLVV